MSVILAVGNQKGGVGKTTTAVTLADLLARGGWRVLLVDLDSQGNVADSLGLNPGKELARLLMPGLGERIGDCTVSSGRPGLDVIRSDKSTTALKRALIGEDFRETVLAQALDQDDHDITILDCAPSVDVLHTAALVAADWLIVPTRLDQLAVKGVRDMLVTLAEMHRGNHTSCRLGGIVPTFYDRVTGESQRQLENLVSQFRAYVLPPIPTDTVCRVATRHGRTLAEHAPGCRALAGIRSGSGKAAGGYLQVVDRLLEIVNK